MTAAPAAAAGPPADGLGDRPADLSYWLDERPPLAHLLLLGLQHAVVIGPYLVLVALVVEAAGLSPQQATPHLGMAMLVVVAHALLQGRRWRGLGSGYHSPAVISAIYLPASLAAAKAGGLPLVAGMVLMAGVSEMLLSRLVGSMRRVFPTVVSGVILMAVGLELARIAIDIVFDARLLGGPDLAPVDGVFLLTLAVMVGLSVWGRGLWKLLAALLGIVGGYGAAALLGQDPAALGRTLEQSSWLGLPWVAPESLRFDATFVVPFLLAGVASGIRAVGVITTAQQLNHRSWSRPDLAGIRGGVLADGIGCSLAGVFGIPGLSVSPTLMGLQRATGATSRSIAWAMSAWLVLFACLPRVSALVLNMPRPVMAAALFFNGCLILVGGMEISFRRAITIRDTFTIGIALLMALATLVKPDFFARLPHWSQPITDSPIAVATLLAVLVNLLFLLGRSRNSTIRLLDADGGSSHRTSLQMLDRQLRSWQVPGRERERVLQVCGDLVERIRAGGASEGPITVSMSTDDFDVRVALSYRGELVSTAPRALTAEPGEEQAFVAGLASYLSTLAADRVRPSCEDRACRIALVFEVA
ncbi:hypothetical protein EVJ50_01390 [Synechococcus sp. RSCCF101]|uniref:uracil-xanthine permease family protein n=1 Tax=Synechococcus sp. RSCCF101 TaxID=2511069 RepID=UPI0012484506|nr:solute carrier family 23 protein [Synechococcus sp. RSCCF101]QEY31107.1 hypothetical protein EVJ50_01390 [Synechococcus sp. RSCCF101]